MSDVTQAGKSFRIRGPTTGKARWATVDILTGGTTRTPKNKYPVCTEIVSDEGAVDQSRMTYRVNKI